MRNKKLNNFLTSGYSFSEDEFESRTKYQLLNSTLSALVLLLATLSVIRYLQLNFFQSFLDLLFIAISIGAIILLRKNRRLFNRLVFITAHLFYVLIIVSYQNMPNYLVGGGWFSAMLLPTFFLLGVRAGIYFVFLAMGSLLLFDRNDFHEAYDVADYIYGVLPILLMGALLYFYEKRNNISTRLLNKKNRLLKQDLLYQNKQQDLIVEQIHDAVIRSDFDGNILSWNRGAKLLFGYAQEEMLGRNISILFKKNSPYPMRYFINKLRRTGEYRAEISMRRKDDTVVDLEFSSSVIRDENENDIGIISFLQDIGQRKKAEEELSHLAHHDPLTALPNRALFNDRLEQAIVKSKRKKNSFALLFIDLDQFKNINDSLGHDVGDEVLVRIAQRLRAIIREEDTLARLGGDEFVILLEHLPKPEYASGVAQKIIDITKEVLSVGKHELFVSSSIGISLYPQDTRNSKDMLKFADTAMYRAKDEGRNNFQFYSSEMTEIAFERVVLEMSLRQALSSDEFEVYYQPQYRTSDDRLIGMEALVRWNHPSMGIIAPFKFIPLAEETGLIVELDRIVMHKALSQVSKWKDEGLNPGTLALNVAVKQLDTDDYLEYIEAALKSYNFDVENLELEVTETQMMKNPEKAIEKLDKLNDMGIQIAIDDFGTGFSSLSYLKRLPVKKLKIDRSFVMNLPDDEEDAAITKAVIAFAKSLNLTVLSEGVETIEQKKYLIEHGCESIQGYLYSKPLDAEQMEALLRS